MSLPTENLLTVSEVASMLHVHQESVRRWSNEGILKCYRIGRRRDRRYDPEDVKTFMEKDNR